LIFSCFDLQQTLQIAGPDVEIAFYTDRNKQYRDIGLAIDRILSDEMPAEEIVLLLPHKYSIDDLRNRVGVEQTSIRSARHGKSSLGYASASSLLVPNHWVAPGSELIDYT
jgi:hypothetical protein